MDRQTQNIISKLLKNIDNYHLRINEDSLKEYSDILNLLKIDNPLHSILAKHINLNSVRDLIFQELQQSKPDNTLKQRIKYKSQVNIDQLDQIVNFSIWKNIPTVNLFNTYENKKNIIKDEVKKNSFFNNNKLNTRNENEEDEEDCKNNKGNTYMSHTINYKRKNNNNNEMDYENYTNSIYNVNKKKTANNANKKINNYYGNNKNKRNEDEDQAEQQPIEDLSFNSAINLINKKTFNNRNRGGVNRREIEIEREDILEDDEKEFINKKQNENKSFNKKFVPPYKNSSSNNNSNNFLNNNTYNTTTYNNKNNKYGNQLENKEKELDEKLKGFDPKLIDFIESEILSFSPNVKWEDIAGLGFAKKTIREIIIWPLLRPDIFKGIRRPPKGLLLFGPPGTGKTMIAKAIASESNSKFFNISASSLMSKWIGESEKLVRTLFALASYYQPSVVFIDEIDSILTARSENECEASRRLKTEFLVQLDGAGTNQDDRILIIGATNRPQEIDDAFIRRLSKRLYIPLPDFNSRKQLVLNVISKEKEKESKYDLSDDDIISIVNMTKGYSGSDLMGVCREAAMMPIRNIEDIYNVQLDNLRGVNLKDFSDALLLVKPSVSEKSIFQYVEWNKEFGSFQIDKEKENDN